MTEKSSRLWHHIAPAALASRLTGLDARPHKTRLLILLASTLLCVLAGLHGLWLARHTPVLLLSTVIVLTLALGTALLALYWHYRHAPEPEAQTALPYLGDSQAAHSVIRHYLAQGQACRVTMVTVHIQDTEYAHLGVAGTFELMQLCAQRLRKYTQLFSLYQAGQRELLLLSAAETDNPNDSAWTEPLLKSFQRPMLVCADLVECQLYMGSCHLPADSDDSDIADAIHRAEIAMLHGKQIDRAHSYHDDSMMQAVSHRRALTQKLNQAMQQQHLRLHYQPIVRASDGMPYSIEALLRWPLDNGRQVPPSEFLNLPELDQSNLLISNWVLDNALQEISAFHKQGYGIHLQVNLTALDLADTQLAERVMAVLDKHNFDPSNLILEIDEVALINNSDMACQVMHELNNWGVRFALDGFGSRMSSLSQLRQYPLQQLKIDRTYIAGMMDSDQDIAIVRSAVIIGEAMNCQIVAEGVEDAGEGARMQALGCELMQGFLFALPMSGEDLHRWMRQQVQPVARSSQPPR